MIEARKIFFVYVDYTKELIPRPFYVGKGLDHRVRIKDRNAKHKNISSKYGKTREIVFSALDETAAFDLEKSLIAEYKTKHEPGNIGCNFSEGGEGPVGYRHTPDAKKLITNAGHDRWSDLNARQEQSQKLKQTHSKAEIREKFSKNVWHNSEVRAKCKASQSVALKAMWTDPEIRARHKATFTPERNRAFGDLVKELWKQPEYKSRIVDGLKRYYSDPINRAKRSAEMKGRENFKRQLILPLETAEFLQNYLNNNRSKFNQKKIDRITWIVNYLIKHPNCTRKNICQVAVASKMHEFNSGIVCGLLDKVRDKSESNKFVLCASEDYHLKSKPMKKTQRRLEWLQNFLEKNPHADNETIVNESIELGDDQMSLNMVMRLKWSLLHKVYEK